MIEYVLISLAIIVFGVLIVLGWGIGLYNRFVSLKQSVKTQWSNIKTEYQRRVDLFANMAESVKSHKNFEKKTLTDVIKARGEGLTGSLPKQAKKMKEMEGLFTKLLALFERYPELKSIEQYNKFIDEVRVTEDRINVARTCYNDIVREYNTTVKQFPSSIIANMFRFTEEQFYVNSESSEDPKNYRVKLD